MNIIGAFIGYFVKNNKKFINFSISMAFSVMVCLSIFELIPESLEYLEKATDSNIKYLLLIGLVLIGIIILKVLDYFIPNHEHHNETELEEDKNLYHIGIVSSVAIILHNIIEGMTIYSTTIVDSHLGLLMLLGVGLHNIPMGIVIYSTLSKVDNSKYIKIFSLILVSISTFIGGIIMYILGDISSIIIGILLSLTLGMIVYIVVFELFSEMLEIKNKKTLAIGIITGVIIFLVSLYFG